MDNILIKDLLTRCILGVNPDERHEKQDVLINLILETDLRPAGLSDRLEDSVDYRALKKRLVDEVERSHFFLVEALAERIAALCLEHPAVQSVRVTVEKPTALRYARSVGVEITRTRMAD